MLSPDRIRLLIELSERGTISAVAEAARYTPSTVSHALSALERQAGVALLERGPRSVRLTEAGETLAREGRAALAALGAAHADAQAVGGLRMGSAVLATFPSAGATFVSRAVAQLRRDHPDLRVRTIDAEPPEAIALLQEGRVDAAVVYRYPYDERELPDGLRERPLLEDPIQLLAADAGTTVALAELERSSFVAGKPGSACSAFVRAACAAAGFEPDIAFQTDDIAFTCALVEAGAAVSLMPRLLIDTARSGVPRRTVTPALPPRMISVLCRAGAVELPAARAWIAALERAAPEFAA